MSGRVCWCVGMLPLPCLVSGSGLSPCLACRWLVWGMYSGFLMVAIRSNAVRASAVCIPALPPSVWAIWRSSGITPPNRYRNGSPSAFFALHSKTYTASFPCVPRCVFMLVSGTPWSVCVCPPPLLGYLTRVRAGPNPHKTAPPIEYVIHSCYVALA